MKKLKIFLLLSILLCFGFVLSSEVHAQGVGRKIFEEGEVLPATTQLRISWGSLSTVKDKRIRTNNDTLTLVLRGSQGHIYIRYGITSESTRLIYDGYDFIPPYTNYLGDHAYCDIDTSTWDINSRTISSVDTYMDYFYWEDLNASTEPSNAKPFEIGDELPAGYIKISWDFTGLTIHQDEFISIEGTNDFVINLSIKYTTQTPIEIDIMGNYIDIIKGNITVILYNISTITEIKSDFFSGIRHTDILNALVWEVVPLDDLDFLDGYMSAREEFGYYDPITEQWLSVEEYLELYGTDKPGQSDFYNNFDKYFIPAMIIVFGGAIVLTILKVFKGRE